MIFFRFYYCHRSTIFCHYSLCVKSFCYNIWQIAIMFLNDSIRLSNSSTLWKRSNLVSSKWHYQQIKQDNQQTNKQTNKQRAEIRFQIQSIFCWTLLYTAWRCHSLKWLFLSREGGNPNCHFCLSIIIISTIIAHLEFKHPGAISLLFKVEIKIVAMLEKKRW